MTERAHRKPLGLNPDGEVGFWWREPDVLPLACRISLWYTSHMRKITTIRLDEADRAASATIKARYGVASDSAAIRLAVRLLAESKRVDVQSGKHRPP
jgi:Arc/MetJ family transcription regulator